MHTSESRRDITRCVCSFNYDQLFSYCSTVFAAEKLTKLAKNYNMCSLRSEK